MDTPIKLPPLQVKSLLRRYDLKPHKGLGQNFLIDENALNKIIKVSEITNDTTVLEIGPGLGSLTRHLAVHSKDVVTIELDNHLIPVLQEVLIDHKNVNVIHADILKIDINQVIKEPNYYVIANIPYYITSAIIRRLMESDNKPLRTVLTIQMEVAQRIIAQPGKLNLLALSVQVFGKPSIAARIPAGSFYPQPDVDSAVVRVDNYPEPVIPTELLPHFFKLAKAGFSQKRKTLKNSISGGMAITKDECEQIFSSAGIDPQRRAQTLSLKDWGNLTHSYINHKNKTDQK